jgi:hypothetical protein
MKTALIILASIAIVLGVVSYFVVFSGSPIILPTATTGNQSSTQVALVASSSPSSSSAFADGSSATAISSAISTTTFQTVFAIPYPVVWSEGQTQFAITEASLTGNNLTLAVNVQTGSSTECIPVDLRLIIDEQGDMEAPSTPASPNFLLDNDTDCTPSPNTAYQNQPVTFAVDPTAAPYLFTTGDASSIYFEIATTTNDGLTVTIPQQSG